MDDHSSGMRIAAHLMRPTRTTMRKRIFRRSELPGRPFLFGLAPGGVCPAASVTSRAVRSYRTFSPLPAIEIAWRFVFCGTFPGVAPAGRYPAPCFRGARTFLPVKGGRPAIWRGPKMVVPERRVKKVKHSGVPSHRQRRRPRCARL